MIISCKLNPQSYNNFFYKSIYYQYLIDNKKILIRVDDAEVESIFFKSEPSFTGYIIGNKSKFLFCKKDLTDYKFHKNLELFI